MAMAGTSLNLRPSSTFRTINNIAAAKTGVAISLKRFVSSSILSRRLLQQRRELRCSGNGAAAVVEEVDGYEEQCEYESRENDGVFGEGEEMEMEKEKRKTARPCELYVCNLPRSSDITDLMEMFKPYGTVFSVEISRSAETGLSRGSGCITMGSMESAKAAIAALDGMELAGREVRVGFSVHMSPKTRNSEALNSIPMKNLVYESPYKLYVGNLAWAVQPHALRSHFSKFGTVASARVLHDQKAGKNRAYGFISFSSASERDKAASLDGTEFGGRRIIVRGLEERI